MWFRHRKHKILVSSLMLAGLGGGLAMAGCHHRHSPEERAEWVTKKVTRELSLTAPQQEKLEAVKKEFLAARAGFDKRRSQAFDTLIAQVKSKKVDPAVLQGIVDAHHQAMEEASPRIIALLSEFHASLTDEQKAKVAEKLEWLRKHFS